MTRETVKTEPVADRQVDIVFCKDSAISTPMYFIRGMKQPTSASNAYMSPSYESAQGYQGIRKDSQKLFIVRESIVSAVYRFFWDVPCFTTLKEAESFLAFVNSWYDLCERASSPDNSDTFFRGR